MTPGVLPPGEPQAGLSNFTLRILSALLLVALVLGLAWLGGLAFRLFAAVLAALVFREWTAMRPAESKRHENISRAALTVFLAVLIAGLPASITLAILGICGAIVLVHGMSSGETRWNAYGIAYAGIPAIALVELRGTGHTGLIAILFLYGVVWATDILAYFAGKSFGGPKLAPRISPGKTWSGAAGGALGGVILGVSIALLADAPMPLGGIGALALLLSVASQMGDLFESAVKRRSGVKDSGTLIPGHGGVMDRVDGLVAAAVLLYLLNIFFSGSGLVFG